MTIVKASTGAIRAWFDGYNATGKMWLALAIVAVAVDAAISYQYGITQTRLHAWGFALVAIFFAILPDAAYSEFEAGRPASGVGITAGAAILGIAALYSHLGYGAGVRVGDVQQTEVQNIKYDDARAKVEDNKTNIKLWRDQLVKLQAENSWAVTVTADGLRAQLASADKSIELETAKGGCKAKCLALMQSKSKIEERIATTEAVSDLQKRIEATQRVIDGYRETAAKTEFRSSSTVNQTNVAAQLYLALAGAEPDKAINPDKVTFSFVNIFIAGGGSLAFMIMAPLGFFVAGRNRKPTVADTVANQVNPASVPMTSSGPVTQAQPQQPIYIHDRSEIHHKDPRWDALMDKLNSNPQLAAAMKPNQRAVSLVAA